MHGSIKMGGDTFFDYIKRYDKTVFSSLNMCNFQIQIRKTLDSGKFIPCCEIKP